ncbi:hypothetical protein N7488_009321 [Penicillium malachiteum]|nr:hypothetical protein N7488_009321 [Penicillium malachiteum]
MLLLSKGVSRWQMTAWGMLSYSDSPTENEPSIELKAHRTLRRVLLSDETQLGPFVVQSQGSGSSSGQSSKHAVKFRIELTFLHSYPEQRCPGLVIAGAVPCGQADLMSPDIDMVFLVVDNWRIQGILVDAVLSDNDILCTPGFLDAGQGGQSGLWSLRARQSLYPTLFKRSS